MNTSATPQTKTGTLAATELRTTNGSVNFTTGTGANIQNDTANNVLITSTTNVTDSINWRLGTSGNDILRLRSDPDGGGVGVSRNFLEIYDPTATPPDYFALSGAAPYDVASLTALINNTSLTFNGTTTTTFAAGSTVLLNGTTTVGGGVSLTKTGYLGGADIFTYVQNLRATPAWVGITYSVPSVGAPTTFVNIAGRFALEYFTETWGTNTKVFWRGATELRAGGAISAQTIGTIPVGARPTMPILCVGQGQALLDTCRITIQTNGDVDYNGSNNPNCAIINFSQIEYFIN